MVGIERDDAKESERQARLTKQKAVILKTIKDRQNKQATGKSFSSAEEERAAALEALREAEEDLIAKRSSELADAPLLTFETSQNKLWRKCKENPFVPLGMAATVAALVYGLVSFKEGNHKMSQRMMRTRVAAQGLTIFAVIGGLVVSGQRTVFGKKTAGAS